MLLEEAETEYGYNSEGPLTLPCNIDFFYKVLSEMEMDGDYDDNDQVHQAGCNFAKGYGSYRLLSPARMVAMEY
ncbi:Auxin-induced protein [Macleaya cordata]|uniref:Auxin-induced protein n=1 Tax=Macleaya cordata TaxID=56857 RepID=A0A200R433_MACCD|nr:Auxin-induced protein [Macleaya cordata]